MILSFKSYVKPILTLYIVVLTFQLSVSELNEIRSDPKTAEALFRRLYKLERTEQAAAIKALLNLGTETKQSKMVEAIADKVFSVIKKSRLILEKAEYVPGETTFPEEDKLRDALSNVLENTAFLGDIILRLPNISQKVISNNTEWNELYKWSLVFTNSSQLIDDQTSGLLNLVNQEMNYTERKPNFMNPYRKIKQQPAEEAQGKLNKVKKKKKLSKGPRLSSRQIGEL